LKKITLSILFIIFLLITSTCSSIENSINNPIIDSVLTSKQALEGLNPSCPDNIKKNQRLVDVQYYSTDGMVHQGQIVIDQRLADDVTEIFTIAFQERFPFASVIPISQFDWSDDRSMASNNTSGFNYREVTGGKKLSHHAYGFAIDINPLLNPYIKNDVTFLAGAVYNRDEPGTLTDDHIIVRAFLKLGWEWGGHWQSLKDYQHFEKIP